jgi:hypothetical protein
MGRIDLYLDDRIAMTSVKYHNILLSSETNFYPISKVRCK